MAKSRSRACLALLLLLAACRPGDDAAEDRREEPPPPAAPQAEFAGRLAVTFDDLPWIGELRPGESRLEATRRLLATLAAYGAPATGFVDCGRVAPGAPVLRPWLEAGMRLGNHTEDHLDLDRAGLDAWIGAARRCDAYLRELTGDTAVYFRYPYLHRGSTRERYRAARAALARLGAPVAPVTINTVDWILAARYTEALRAGDAGRAAAIGEALVEHVARATAHYREVAREKVGRDLAHVLLLHANALAADYLDEVLERLRGEGFRFVPLAAALEDPVYGRPDDYIGPEGLSWLYRIRPATPEMAAWDDAEAARLRALFR